MKSLKKHTHIMKSIFAMAAVALLVACNSNSSSNNADLELLFAERDSLALLQSDIADRLRELENEIIAKDSTRRFHSVTVLDIVPQPFKHYFQVYGTIQASKSISIYPETNGIISKIYVSRGQKVSQGQLLVELDGNVLGRNITEIKTSLELATILYEKQRKLWFDEKIGSEVQYLQAKNNKESLETRLATLEAQYKMTRLRAPFSGVIDEIFPKEGEMASAMQPLIRLVNLSDVYISADVSEAYVGQISRGTKALATLTSINHSVESEVVQVGSFINPTNRTFKVEVALPEKNELYKPNMLASVNLLDFVTDSAIVVPSSIIQQSPSGENFVYVLNKIANDLGEVKRVDVEIGLTYENATHVKSGLAPGDLLINKGSRSVKDGQRVRVFNQ